MPAYKDENTGTWYTQFYYQTHTGERKKKKKRGFKLKKEALDWERDFLSKQDGSPDMLFSLFWEEYKEDMKDRIQERTWIGKIAMVDTKIMPFFENIPLNKIDERTIIKWQSWILSLKKGNGKPYSATYIKSINNQLSAILNHAVIYYKLSHNPIHKTGSIGSKEAENIDFWTLEEFNTFIPYYEEDLLYYLIFNLLYYTGMRQGEMLALTPKDFCLDNQTIDINKNWGVRKGKNVLTQTKTKSSNRVITFPEFLIPQIESYYDQIYNLKTKDLLFSPYTNKYQLNRRLKQGTNLIGEDYFQELLERVRSIRASERRIWQKITDIFAEVSSDYDKDSQTTKLFFANIQNKFHYAITGKTAAEIIYDTADKTKKNMGLVTWKNSPEGRILKSDTQTAKNYLNEKEIKVLERNVSSYFDYIEGLIERRTTFTMEEFAKSIDNFLNFNEYEILEGFGKVRMKDAKNKAALEYDEFNKTQKIESDFDKEIKKLLE